MKKYFSFLIILGLVVLAANPVVAANKYGAKAYGMGGAFTAVADDASAVYWNPAGLTQNSLIGLQTSVGGQVDPDAIEDISNFIKDLEDLEGTQDPSAIKDIKLPDDAQINVNGIAAANLSKIGVGLIANNQFEFSGEEVPVNGVDVPQGTANNLLTAQGIVGYGSEFIDPPLVGSLSWGVSGKMLRGREDTAETTVNNDNKVDVVYDSATDSGFGADVGALITLSDIDILNLKAGATIKNAINTMDMESDALERTTTLGAGATFKFPLVEILSARVAADLEMPENGENIQRYGMEGTLGLFSLRAGMYDSNDMEEEVYTGGLGFNVPFIDFNLVMDSEDYYSASGTFNF